MTGPIADNYFRTYGIPRVHWDKDKGLGSLGTMGQHLAEYVQGPKLIELLETRRGLHLHGPGSLRHPVLPYFCRALLILGHKAYYRRADYVATYEPDDDPEEFVRKHLDADVLCVDHINYTKNGEIQPHPWDEDSHYRFEARLLRWIEEDGVLITCGDLNLSDTPLREHVAHDLCEHVAREMDLSEL